MNTLVPFIRSAAGVQLVIFLGNFIIPEKLHCREEIKKLTPIVRQVFIIHYFYILLVLLGFGGLCFFYPEQLAGATPLGRTLSGFFAVFWGLRVVTQLFYYDAKFKSENALGNVVFICGFIYLAIVFTVAALGVIR